MEVTFAPRNLLEINDARIRFRNFKGLEDTYNHEGDRNFALIIAGGTLDDGHESAIPCIIELTNPTPASMSEPMLADNPLMSDTKKFVRLSKNSGILADNPSNICMMNVTNESII